MAPAGGFLESFTVVVEEEEEDDDELTCEGAVGCCDDRARDDLLGDILEEDKMGAYGWW